VLSSALYLDLRRLLDGDRGIHHPSEGRDPGSSRHMMPRPGLHSRIALVMPVYNEDPRRTTAGLDALDLPVGQSESAAFDLFILSG